MTSLRVRLRWLLPMILLLFAGSLVARENYDALYRKHGYQWGVDPLLLKSIAIIESNENARAINADDPSYGLMQVQCIPDRAVGCSNQFNVLNWPPARRDRLFDPDYNLHIATQIFTWDVQMYGLLKGIAVYNSWAARFSPARGPFPNQRYVDAVLRVYRKLGGKL